MNNRLRILACLIILFLTGCANESPPEIPLFLDISYDKTEYKSDEIIKLFITFFLAEDDSESAKIDVEAHDLEVKGEKEIKLNDIKKNVKNNYNVEVFKPIGTNGYGEIRVFVSTDT